MKVIFIAEKGMKDKNKVFERNEKG